MTDIRIRPAEQGDTRFLAWVILEAGRSHLPRGISDLLISDEQKRIDFLNAIVSAEEPSMFHESDRSNRREDRERPGRLGRRT